MIKVVSIWLFGFYGLLIITAALCVLKGNTGATGFYSFAAQSGLSTDWMTEPWDGNEKPFLRCRAEIQKSISAAVSIHQAFNVYQAYELQAKAQPEDALAQFAWSYAASTALRSHKELGRKILLSDPGSSLARVKSPRTYEFARLRFLYEVREHAVSPHTLKKLAERLLRRNSGDYRVRFYYFETLDLRKPADRIDVEKQVEQLMKEFREQPSRINLKGYVYFRLWCVTDNPVHAQKAEDAYRLYLQQPTTPPYRRKSVQRTINLMHRLMRAKEGNDVQHSAG